MLSRLTATRTIAGTVEERSNVYIKFGDPQLIAGSPPPVGPGPMAEAWSAVGRGHLAKRVPFASASSRSRQPTPNNSDCVA